MNGLIGDAVIYGTAHVAMLLFAATLALRLSRGDREPAARACWSAGLLCFVAHLAAAFHFAHGWSHDQAYAHTAQRTADTIGWRWGGGLYANYLFTLVWFADCLWWWLDQSGYRTRSAAVERLIYGFMIFMAFNATVVFGRGATVWIGLAVSLSLAIRAWFRRTRVLGA